MVSKKQTEPELRLILYGLLLMEDCDGDYIAPTHTSIDEYGLKITDVLRRLEVESLYIISGRTDANDYT